MKRHYIWLLALVLSLHACKTKDKDKDKDKTYAVINCLSTKFKLCADFRRENNTKLDQNTYDDLTKNCQTIDPSVDIQSRSCDHTQFTHKCQSVAKGIVQNAYGDKATLMGIADIYEEICGSRSPTPSGAPTQPAGPGAPTQPPGAPTQPPGAPTQPPGAPTQSTGSGTTTTVAPTSVIPIPAIPIPGGPTTGTEDHTYSCFIGLFYCFQLRDRNKLLTPTQYVEGINNYWEEEEGEEGEGIEGWVLDEEEEEKEEGGGAEEKCADMQPTPCARDGATHTCSRILPTSVSNELFPGAELEFIEYFYFNERQFFLYKYLDSTELEQVIKKQQMNCTSPKEYGIGGLFETLSNP